MDYQRRNIALAVVFAGLNEVFKSKRRKRRFWVKEYRRRFGHIPLLHELRENHPDDFKNYLRMNSFSFETLLNKVKHKITKQDTIMRRSISAEERLVATLRFLATGRSFEDMKFSSGISSASLSILIPETCKAIYDVLKAEYMKFPTNKEEWRKIAYDFQNKWQFINCGGSLDGKHIRIVPPPHSGALYYNYKNFYSIVLMALVDANYKFLYVDVGKNGRLSDGGVLEYTTFYQKLISKQLNLPANSDTVKNLNFVFVGDEAFGLNEHFLKPYAQRELDKSKKVFNYRVSRARNVVENAFGIISSRFRVLQTAINMKPENICHVVMAICVLHNFLCVSSDSYTSHTTVDREDVQSGTIQKGDWRTNTVQLLKLQSCSNTPTFEAKVNRENYKNYFNSEGRVDWQDLMIASGRA